MAGGLSAPLSVPPGLGCHPWVPPPCEGAAVRRASVHTHFPAALLFQKDFFWGEKHFFIKMKLMHCGAEGIS